MNIEEKINKYLKESVNIEDIKKLQGKNIKILTVDNSIFSGRLHIPSNKEIILCDLIIYDKKGNFKASSKYNEKRSFKVDKIKSFEKL